MAATSRQTRTRLAPLELPRQLEVGETYSSTIVVDDVRFERTMVCTPWLSAGQDLAEVLRQWAMDHLRSGDVLAITEKAVVVTTGRGVPAAHITPGRLATFLSSRVRPVGDSRGLSIPHKAQLVIDMVGRGRIAAAAVAAAITRPFGIHGAFYVVAGNVARCMDGMRPPYGDMLLPPLTREIANGIAEQLTTDLGHPCAIVDINDRGGSIRALAGSVLSSRQLRKVMADNPMGQRNQATPIAIIRRLD